MSKHSKSGGQRNYRRQRDKVPQIGEQGADVLEHIDENSAVIQQFKVFAQELDAKHDKYERLVKISRDVTIESKRLIFLLHTLLGNKNEEKILEEADKKITLIISQHFMLIARELEGMDPYQFHRAFTAGVQEFIEAITFYHYLKDKAFYHWKDYEAKLVYHLPNPPTESDEMSTRPVAVHIPPSDFILGLADLTGELMRKCINSLGSGDIKDCFQTCDVVRKMYSGFLMISNARLKDFSHKKNTLRQSLLKMEGVCYNIHVRGTEVPKHVLTEVFLTDEFHDNDDEGYYN